MISLRILLFVLGGVLLLISLALFMAGALGFLGMLADVSRAENRALGSQLLQYGLWVNGGAILCVVVGRRMPHRRAEPPANE